MPRHSFLSKTNEDSRLQWASLAALVPDYLDSVPTTYDGKTFTYNSQTSAVGLPGKTPTARESTGSGITPVGDAFTGLSVQNELDF